MRTPNSILAVMKAQVPEASAQYVSLLPRLLSDYQNSSMVDGLHRQVAKG